MKFNWGVGIFLFYSIFAASLFYQVYASTKYSNDLVEENYYEKDLAYQSRYERIENSLSLEEPVEFNYYENKKTIEVNFPKGENIPTGKVRLYRADDEKKDMRVPVFVNNEGIMPLNTEELTVGVWKLEVEWEMDGELFFDEKSIFLK